MRRTLMTGAVGALAVAAIAAGIVFVATSSIRGQPTVSWTTTTPPLDGVGAIAADGDQLLAVGYSTDAAGSTTPAVWSTAAGRDWTASNVEDDRDGQMLAAIHFRDDWLALGNYHCLPRGCPDETPRGIPASWSAEGDGRHWTPRAASGLDGYARGLATNGERLVLAGSMEDRDITTTGAIWHSDDGRTWQRASGMHSVDALRGVTAFTGGFAALGFRAGGRPEYHPVILVSTDGDQWVEADLAHELPGVDIVSMAATHRGLVGVGSMPDAAGQYAAAAFESSDGLRWQRLSLDFGDAVLELVASGEMGTIIVGRDDDADGIGTPVAWFSRDAEHWSARAEMGLPEANLAIVYATVGRTRALVIGLSLPFQDARHLAWVAEAE